MYAPYSGKMEKRTQSLFTPFSVVNSKLRVDFKS